MIHSLLYNLCSSLISVSKTNQSRLPPEVNRILYVRNLPFKITSEELYDIFGKYGAVYQIRLGERGKDTRGTAFVGECIYLFIYFLYIVCLSHHNIDSKPLLFAILIFAICNTHIVYVAHTQSNNQHTLLKVYEDIYDAKRAVDHLSGFNVGGRYLVVMYYQPAKFEKRADAAEKKREIEELRRQIKNKKAQMARQAAATEGGQS